MFQSYFERNVSFGILIFIENRDGLDSLPGFENFVGLFYRIIGQIKMYIAKARFYIRINDKHLNVLSINFYD